MSSRSRRASEPVTREGNPLYDGSLMDGYTYDQYLKEMKGTSGAGGAGPKVSDECERFGRLISEPLRDFDPQAYEHLIDLFRQGWNRVDEPKSGTGWELDDDPPPMWTEMSVRDYFIVIYGLSDERVIGIAEKELRMRRDRMAALEGMRPEVEKFIESEIPDFYEAYLEYANAIGVRRDDLLSEDAFINECTGQAYDVSLFDRPMVWRRGDPEAKSVADWKDDLRNSYDSTLKALDGLREALELIRKYDALNDSRYGNILDVINSEMPRGLVPISDDITPRLNRKAAIAQATAEFIKSTGISEEEVPAELPEAMMESIRSFVAEYVRRNKESEDGETLPRAYEVRRRYWKGGKDGERPEGAAIPTDPETGKAMLYMTTDNLMSSLTDFAFQTAIDDYRFSASRSMKFSGDDEKDLTMTLYIPAGPDSQDLKGIVMSMTMEHIMVLNYIGSRFYTSNSKDYRGTKVYKTSLKAFVDGLIATNGVKLNKEKLAPHILNLLKMMRQCSVKIDFTVIRREHQDVWEKLESAGFDDSRTETALLDIDFKETATADGVETNLVFLRMPPIYLYGLVINQFVPYDSALLRTPPTDVTKLGNKVARNMALTLNLTGTGSNSGMISLEQDLINREIKEWVLRAINRKLRIWGGDERGSILLDLDTAFHDIYGITFPNDPRDTKDPEYKRLNEQRGRLQKNIETYLAFLIEKRFIAFVKRRVLKSRANGKYRTIGWFVYKSEKSFDREIVGIFDSIRAGEPFYEPGTFPRQQVKAEGIRMLLRQRAPR